MRLASGASMARMTPCACRLRTMTAYAWLASRISSVYRPAPRSSLGSSMRDTGCPMPNLASATSPLSLRLLILDTALGPPLGSGASLGEERRFRQPTRDPFLRCDVGHTDGR